MRMPSLEQSEEGTELKKVSLAFGFIAALTDTASQSFWNPKNSTDVLVLNTKGKGQCQLSVVVVFGASIYCNLVRNLDKKRRTRQIEWSGKGQ